MNPYTGVHHAAFATSDILATVRYWRDLLGMQLIYTDGGPGYRQYFFNIHGGSRISFFEWPDVQKVPYKRHGAAVPGPFGFDHLSIGVVNEEALWNLVARLEEAGFPVSDVIDHGCFLSIYSYDPNGIAIEFSCDAPGVDLLHQPLFKDKNPPSEWLHCADPIPGHWPEPTPIPPEERVIIPGEGKEHFPAATVDRNLHKESH